LQPLIDPNTREPAGSEIQEAVFPEALMRQEVSGDRFIQIPEEVRGVYPLWKPTSSFRSTRSEGMSKAKAGSYSNYGGIGPPLARKNETIEEVTG